MEHRDEQQTSVLEAAEHNWNLDQILTRLIGHGSDDLQTPADIERAFEALYPTWQVVGPELLYRLWKARSLNRLPDKSLHRILLDVWRYTDFPCQGCPPRVWRSIFRATGFLSDGAPEPTRPMVLYRGCGAVGRQGMSWTTRRWMADKFADYWFDQDQGPRGHVYKTRVSPRDILAIVDGQKEEIHVEGIPRVARIKPEFEVIIDPRSVPIALVETAQQRSRRLVRDEPEMEAERIFRTEVRSGLIKDSDGFDVEQERLANLGHAVKLGRLFGASRAARAEGRAAREEILATVRRISRRASRGGQCG